jgi:hypothetical protein
MKTSFLLERACCVLPFFTQLYSTLKSSLLSSLMSFALFIFKHTARAALFDQLISQIVLNINWNPHKTLDATLNCSPLIITVISLGMCIVVVIVEFDVVETFINETISMDERYMLCVVCQRWDECDDLINSSKRLNNNFFFIISPVLLLLSSQTLKFYSYLNSLLNLIYLFSTIYDMMMMFFCIKNSKLSLWW